MLVSGLRAAEAEVVIKAFILAWRRRKVWFQTDSKERVMLSFTGSHYSIS